MKTTLFIALQYLLPQHLLSRLAGCIAETEVNAIKGPFIRWFIKKYRVDMSIAANPDPDSYRNFNDFFTRPLKDGARPIAKPSKAICCPADGCISQIGAIDNGYLFQAKGHKFHLLELLGGDEASSKLFLEGNFATVYLSPKDYHRVHMPLAGKLTKMIHIPGDLFSVNDTTASHVPRLFARNERVVCLFDTAAGPMAVILVGAMIVASIETVWAGLITPIKKQVRTIDYTTQPKISLKKGEELGRFKLGSTAIVLFGKNAIDWKQAIKKDSEVIMGEAIGKKKLG